MLNNIEKQELKKIDCPICKSKNITEIYSEFPGYIEGTSYNIFSCNQCNIQFISKESTNKTIYNIIYSQKNAPGYDRYYRYAQTIKDQKNPLLFLANEEPSYYSIDHIFSSKKTKQKILEIGCGYGYLTYALNKIGHNAIGIDISNEAIQYAKSNFGDNYYLTSYDDFKTNENFDFIIATEFIEHIVNPIEFIHICIRLLNKKGKIILTTPNKDYLPKKTVWFTEQPPVHTIWFTKNSIKFMADSSNLNCHFVDFSKYNSMKENKLITYFSSLSRRKNIPDPIISKEGNNIYKKKTTKDFIVKKYIKKLLLFAPARFFMNILYNFINSEYYILGAILEKK
ncbi:class I SAM-dependent methyltransferase [Patescibacteria group bacterium]|nr:class I SAM-dependent methyltransferase [Patescibacteria group bacterium]MBU1951366.1 class I SAM-dependent methyltransferase [Patescibacteria group bacterium]